MNRPSRILIKKMKCQNIKKNGKCPRKAVFGLSKFSWLEADLQFRSARAVAGSIRGNHPMHISREIERIKHVATIYLEHTSLVMQMNTAGKRNKTVCDR